jgi:hypothetical protein
VSTLIALIAIACVVLWSIIATIELVSRDGYGPVPFNPAHEQAAFDRTQRLRSA